MFRKLFRTCNRDMWGACYKATCFCLPEVKASLLLATIPTSFQDHSLLRDPTPSSETPLPPQRPHSLLRDPTPSQRPHSLLRDPTPSQRPHSLLRDPTPSSETPLPPQRPHSLLRDSTPSSEIPFPPQRQKFEQGKRLTNGTSKIEETDTNCAHSHLARSTVVLCGLKKAGSHWVREGLFPQG